MSRLEEKNIKIFIHNIEMRQVFTAKEKQSFEKGKIVFKKGENRKGSF